MKRLTMLLMLALLITLLSPGAAALDDTSHGVRLTYDLQTDTLCAEISVTSGDAIVGHFGLAFNTQKLRVVTLDGAEIPGTVPESTDSGKSYLTQVVASADQSVIITQESNKPADLVSNAKGYVLFGWYATKDVDAVSPAVNNGRIATIRFKTAEGVSVEDLTDADLYPVPTALCSGLSGWSSGIIVINSQSKVYSASSDDSAYRLVTTVITDFGSVSDSASSAGQSSTPDASDSAGAGKDGVSGNDGADTAANSAENTGNNTGSSADDTDTDISNGTESGTSSADHTAFKPNGKSQTVDFSLQAKVFSDKLRLQWKSPQGYPIRSYRITLKDSDGNTVRDLDGIVGVTRSLTVEALAPDFAFTAELRAYAADGTLLVADKPLAVQTAPRLSGAAPVAFRVSYDPANGDMYGFDAEDVLFGDTPTKTPTVFPPEGFEFIGWSLDGKNVTDLSTARIYADTLFVALYTAA